jgi:hypothetical protein
LLNVDRYLRVIFINLIPCVLLVALNVRLFLAMREAQIRRRQLLRIQSNAHQSNHHRSAAECRRLAENNAATLMLLTVVGVFLLVEFPLAVMLVTMIIENQFDSVPLMDPGERRTATLFVNLVIMFSYPVNFFIYCGMSNQFRQTFKRLFSFSISSSPTTRTTQAADGDAAETASEQQTATGCCSRFFDRNCRRGSRPMQSVMMSMVTDNVPRDERKDELLLTSPDWGQRRNSDANGDPTIV